MANPTRRRARGSSSIERPIAGGAEPDHRLVEVLRTQPRLKLVTIRLGEEQIAEAKLLSHKTGQPYQTILRRWVSDGAAAAQEARHREDEAKRKKPKR